MIPRLRFHAFEWMYVSKCQNNENKAKANYLKCYLQRSVAHRISAKEASQKQIRYDPWKEGATFSEKMVGKSCNDPYYVIRYFIWQILLFILIRLNWLLDHFSQKTCTIDSVYLLSWVPSISTMTLWHLTMVAHATKKGWHSRKNASVVSGITISFFQRSHMKAIAYIHM